MLAGCRGGGHSAQSTADSSSAVAAEETDDPSGNWYKRFSGTLAGKAIVVQLHRYNGRVKGSYQYTSIGQTISLADWDDSLKSPVHIRLTELVAQDGADGAVSDGAIWSLSLDGADATGEWTRGSKHYTIALHEEYPEGSTRLKAFYHSDSAALIPGKASSPAATITHSYLLPAGEKGFLYDALLAQLWPGSKPGDDAGALIRAGNARYFSDYRQDNNVDASSAPDADDFTLQYTSDEVLTVLYNDGGWLVTEDFTSDYTGGAHGNYGSAFANIDLDRQRIWNIKDVVADTTALRPFLAQAAIAYFRLRPGDRMDDRLLVDAIPPTDNFFLSATGLTMVYNPYEVASYADGQVKLFLPYSRILDLLTPAFRERMGLSGSRGLTAGRTTPGKKWHHIFSAA